MNTSDKIDQVSASLFAVQRDVELPKKDARGQVRGRADYRYLSLPALIDHLKPHLKQAQLYVTQELTGGPGYVEVTTTVWHFSGQRIDFGPTHVPAPNDPQGVGSAATYARRYALAAVFNLAADEDDDATSARTSKPGGQGRGDTSSAPPLQPDTGADHLDGPVTDAATAAGSDPDGDGSRMGKARPSTEETQPAAAPVDAFLTNRYLTPEDQQLLKLQHGSPTKALKVYRERFGERIKRLGDITYEMRDEIEGAA